MELVGHEDVEARSHEALASLVVHTSEWDEYDDGFVHQKKYIAYCPWCGRKLGE